MKKVKCKELCTAACLFVAGILIGIAGVYIGEIDDAPGAALLGILLMIGLIFLGIRAAWHKR